MIALSGSRIEIQDIMLAAAIRPRAPELAVKAAVGARLAQPDFNEAELRGQAEAELSKALLCGYLMVKDDGRLSLGARALLDEIIQLPLRPQIPAELTPLLTLVEFQVELKPDSIPMEISQHRKAMVEKGTAMMDFFPEAVLYGISYGFLRVAGMWPDPYLLTGLYLFRGYLDEQ